MTSETPESLALLELESKIAGIKISDVTPKLPKLPKVITPPTVVRIRRSKGEIVQNCDIYIGRSWNMGGWKLKGSKWQNPFSVKKYGRENCLIMYENHITNSPELMESLKELEGKTLGCFCHLDPLTDVPGFHRSTPKSCHGDVLVRLFIQKFGKIEF